MTASSETTCISPPARIVDFGAVTIGEGAHVGIGASVRQGIVIGRNVVVGAGAAVVADAADEQVLMGVPARSVTAPRQ